MRADVVGFVALAVEREQFARELWVYKDGRENVRRRPQFGLAAVPWRWLALHEGCLALAAGAERFDLVTTVPSTKQRVDHPLTEIVRTLVGPTRERYRELLQPRDPTDNSREAADDRFICEAELEGEPVLVVDDTWTTGAHAQSAACSLRRSGSGPVAVLALGRRFALSGAEEHREAAQRYLTRAPIGSFRWEQCCLCGR